MGAEGYDHAYMQVDADLTWDSQGRILGILKGCTYLARPILARNPVSLGCSANRSELGESPCLQDVVGLLGKEDCLGIPGRGVHNNHSRGTEKPYGTQFPRTGTGKTSCSCSGTCTCSGEENRLSHCWRCCRSGDGSGLRSPEAT